MFKTPVYGQNQAPSTGRTIGANDRITIGFVGVGGQGMAHVRSMKEHAAENNVALVATAESVFFAGGGVRGGTVIGASDRLGAYPSADPQRPENMAASIYQALGLPRTLVWKDPLQRPHQVYHGEPIPGLT